MSESDKSQTTRARTADLTGEVSPDIAQGKETGYTDPNQDMNSQNEAAAIAENQRRYDEAVAGEDKGGQVTSEDQAAAAEAAARETGGGSGEGSDAKQAREDQRETDKAARDSEKAKQPTAKS